MSQSESQSKIERFILQAMVSDDYFKLASSKLALENFSQQEYLSEDFFAALDKLLFGFLKQEQAAKNSVEIIRRKGSWLGFLAQGVKKAFNLEKYYAVRGARSDYKQGTLLYFHLCLLKACVESNSVSENAKATIAILVEQVKKVESLSVFELLEISAYHSLGTGKLFLDGSDKTARLPSVHEYILKIIPICQEVKDEYSFTKDCQQKFIMNMSQLISFELPLPLNSKNCLSRVEEIWNIPRKENDKKDSCQKEIRAYFQPECWLQWYINVWRLPANEQWVSQQSDNRKAFQEAFRHIYRQEVVVENYVNKELSKNCIVKNYHILLGMADVLFTSARPVSTRLTGENPNAYARPIPSHYGATSGATEKINIVEDNRKCCVLL